jgi:hypothetical protein
MQRAYIPSGKSDPGALAVLAAASIGVGLGAGLVEGIISYVISLLLIFPVALGAAVGAAAHWAIDKRKIRKPIAAAAIALAAGFMSQATLHVMAYREARGRVAERLESDPQAQGYIAEHGLSSTIDTVFSGEEHLPPLVGYLEIASKNGITITNHGSSSSSSPTLTGIGVYLLWVAEFLLACGVAGAMAFKRAKAPFCEACNEWYDAGSALAVGAGDRKAVKETRQRFEAGQLAEAVRELGASDGKTATVVLVKGCPKACPTHEPMLELKSMAGLNTNKRQEAVVYRSLITQSEAQALRAAAPAPA